MVKRTETFKPRHEKSAADDLSLRASEQLDALVRAGGCDLHLHTTASDGTHTPAELFNRVQENQLRCFAVTDHDVMQSLPEMVKLVEQACRNSSPADSKQNCPIFVPGVEVSVSEGRELHLLAYFPLGGENLLDVFLQTQQNARHARNLAMVERLNQLGYVVTLDELIDKGQGVVGRMQAAHLLVERGYVHSTREAFDRVLGFGKPGYIERPRPSLKEAIAEIRRCGGVPVLAHPAVYHWCDESNLVSPRLIHHLADAKAKGLLGVEAFHGEASPAACLEISAAARYLGLIRTAGSDDHGANKTNTSLYTHATRFLAQREILVTGALVRDNEGRYLLARRSTGGHGHGKWELPGGKVEPGEEPKACLLREIQEELGVQAKDLKFAHLLTHGYDGFRVILAVFETVLSDTNFVLTAHDQIIWKTASEALSMDLLAADIALFEALNRENA